MADQVTRKNHYVPEWYQRGFNAPGESKLHHLDMSPEQRIVPDGRTVTMNAVHKWGPKKCFYEHDLYSTHFGTLVNDEIERFLFGPIDVRGAKAVRAFIGGDLSEMHDTFQDFFEYLDAQKLRTPKGLDWIKSRYSLLDQLHLMREMQGLRLMHCTMWAEGVREIVSAEECDVKFIVSDHPVAAYNAGVPPTSPQCLYPEDPSIEWMGTQTVFALDADTCLILTHLEYAEDPKGVNLTAPRTHARYSGHGLVRTDAFIRTRKLSRDEVITINYLLKSRSRRYLAASNREWLYPEQSFTGAWQDIAHVLLPKDDLWRFGGEIYAGRTDGSTYYQDAFGRTSRAHEYLRRKTSKTDLGPNEACGCGSGRKFKHCCKNLSQADRPAWDVYGIRERNLVFCTELQEILGLRSGKTWDDVRRELSDEQVNRIHKAFGSLWPEDTDLSVLLPRPRKDTFRAVYLGVSDPRTVEAMVLGWLPYFDEVVLAHPFINPLGIKPEFSPTESSAKYKAQTLKNVLLLLLLEPYIQAGYVHLIPDPGDFDPQFGRSALQMAQQRTAGWKPEGKMGVLEAIAEDDRQRLISQLPDSTLRSLMRQHVPRTSDAEVDALIEHSKAELAADPYALLQPIEPGEKGAQLLYLKGYSLESAMYLAALTGSAIYTDSEAHWQQLHLHAQQGNPPSSVWTSIVNGVLAVEFPIDIDARSLYQALRAGRFGSMRTLFRRISEAAREQRDATRPDQIALQTAQAAQAMLGEWTNVPLGARLAGKIELSIPAGGFDRTEVRRLLLKYGKAKSVHPMPFAMLIKLEGEIAAES